jgi:hypothetical protein
MFSQDHAHMNIHTHTHTQTFTRINIRTHTQTQTFTRISIHTHTHKHTHKHHMYIGDICRTLHCTNLAHVEEGAWVEKGDVKFCGGLDLGEGHVMLRGQIKELVDVAWMCVCVCVCVFVRERDA